MYICAHRHRELVVREQSWHEVEEVVVVLPEDDRLKRDLGKDGLERWRELALRLPVFLRDRLLQNIDSCFEVGMKGLL